MPNISVPAAAEGLPGFQHPKLLEARRLLNIAPELERLNIADDGVRIIAGQHAVRRLAEEAAETLIDLLDELEGDSDLEENQDAEPSLGWSVDHRHGPDVEDRELDPAEEEPSLGWTAGINQASRNWLGGIDDREDEHDGREPDVADYEPSLGALETHPCASTGERGDQSRWGDSSTTDREDDGDDREPDYDNEPEGRI